MLDSLNNLIELLSNSFLLVFNFVVYLVNLLIWLVCGIVNLIVSILPDSPFSNIDFMIENQKYLSYLNWLIPIDTILNITFAWCGCLIVYKGYSIVMRWFKLIS